jgi:hypothetical protein
LFSEFARNARFRAFSRFERARFGHWRSARRPNSRCFL